MTGFRETVRSLLREQVLDAAASLTSVDGWTKLRVSDIARLAGVSRQTVYNEFGTKDAIGRALVQREAERFLVGVEQELEAHRDDLGAAATAGVGYVLRQAESNPLVKAAIAAARGGHDDLVSYLTTRSEPVFDTATAMLDAYAARVWPEVDADSRDLAVETIVRLTVSHIVQPSGPPEQTARRIARVVVRIAYPAGGVAPSSDAADAQ